MSQPKTVAIVAFDHDGYAYGFTSEETFFAWLEPETVGELDAVYDRNGEQLEINQVGNRWVLVSSGKETRDVLIARLRKHDEMFGRSDSDESTPLTQLLDLLLKGRHFGKG